jgi:hypothetical protein
MAKARRRHRRMSIEILDIKDKRKASDCASSLAQSYRGTKYRISLLS